MINNMCFYNFYEKVPLDYDSEKTPENKAEELAVNTMKNALSNYPGTMTPDDAVKALEKSADMGFLSARYWCGWLYQYQPLIFQREWYWREYGSAIMNYRKAEKYYLKAIKAGDNNALYGLATLYIFGTYDYEHMGIALTRGLSYMVEAARKGVSEAAKALGKIFANDIYRDEEEIQSYLHGIKVNKYRDQSGLRYDEDGNLLFDADALGLLNFEYIRNDTLSAYWYQRISDPHSKEPSNINTLMLEAVQALMKYEKAYLDYWKSWIERERKDYIKLRESDREFRFKRKLDEEMHSEIEAIPLGALSPKITEIYDKYEEKRKQHFERKRLKKMKNAIGITITKAPEKYDLGASKFFGTPTVPDAWTDKFDENEMFLCQIKLSDIAELDKENKLPHTGYLYIFLDMSCFPYKPRVLYYDGEPDTAIDDFNAEAPFAGHLNEAWLMSFDEAEEDAAGIKLLGIPADWSYEEEPPRLLLQYDPLQEYTGFLDSIDGFAYFVFDENSDKFEDVKYLEERS